MAKIFMMPGECVETRGGVGQPADASRTALREVANPADSVNGDSRLHELFQVIERWDGVGVVAHYDRPTETWMFVAIHDTGLGSAVGGCRMGTYATPADGLRDALRLAEGMTCKWATIGFGFGGGKAVLAVPRTPRGAARRGLLRRFGALLESLGGAYATGADLGTTPADMSTLAEVTRFVHGLEAGTGRPIDPGPYTALGVFAGIKSALARTFGGDGNPAGRTVLIQGVGHVGAPLARMLRREGARLLLTDVNQERAQRLAVELGGGVVATEALCETACDVYAPCATGGTLSAETAPRLRCRVVAGAANNQLQSEDAAALLHGRRILYAPDYVVNAGGAIALPMLHGGAGEAEVRERIEGISETLEQIFAEAAALDEPPIRAARRRVERTLARAK